MNDFVRVGGRDRHVTRLPGAEGQRDPLLRAHVYMYSLKDPVLTPAPIAKGARTWEWGRLVKLYDRKHGRQAQSLIVNLTPFPKTRPPSRRSLKDLDKTNTPLET